MISIILHMIRLNTQVLIQKGVIAKVGEYLSIFLTLLTSKLNLTYLLIVKILNQLP